MPVQGVGCEILMFGSDYGSFLTDSPLETDRRGRIYAEFTISSENKGCEIIAEITSAPEGYSMQPVRSVISDNIVSDSTSASFTLFIEKTEES